VTNLPEPTQLLAVLRRAADELDRLRVPWALVGGLAVSARAEPRFTRDVDLAVSVADDARAEALVADLGAAGFRILSSLEQDVVGRLATVRLGAPAPLGSGIVVDLLFSSSGIEPDICDAAERLDVVPGFTLPIARAGHLVAMKLLARSDRRLQDEIDLRSLATVLAADDVRLARRAVAKIEAVRANRGRDLGADLERYLAQHGIAG